MSAVDELVGISGQCHEIMKRVGSGSLDPRSVKETLQMIIDGRIALEYDSPNTPWWYESTERQIQKVGRVLRSNHIANTPEFNLRAMRKAIPKDFQPLTPTEVLMLSVYLPDNEPASHSSQWTFWAWWTSVEMGKVMTFDQSAVREFAYAFNQRREPGFKWVAFDPNANAGISPKKAREIAPAKLAGIEVLMAAALFPKWATAIDGIDQKKPIMSGLSYSYEGDHPQEGRHAYAPTVRPSSEHPNSLSIHLRGTDTVDPTFSNPTVRVLD